MTDRKRAVSDYSKDASSPNASKDRESSKYDEPPNSRLFIVCGKSITEKEFHDAFSRFGKIEEVWVVRDRSSGEPKGVAYIKFSKTSDAALAMEEMNGTCIASHPRPLKVLIAHSREQGSRRDIKEEERLLRLFIVVPKDASESEIRHHFQQFGDIDYVSVVRDRNTRESKGFAYVKYHRITHAARAFEGCDKSYRPVFADPKPQKQENDRYNFTYNSAISSSSGEYFSNVVPMYPDNPPSSTGQDNLAHLSIVASPTLNQDQLWRLFDLVPGMDYLQLIRDSKTHEFKGNAVAVYKNPQAASYAQEKLHGFEYPIGQRLIVKSDFQSSQLSGVSQTSLLGNGVLPAKGQQLSSDLATLAETIAQATSIIQAAKLHKPSSSALPADDSLNGMCSVALPPRQPRAPFDAEVAERLFIVCQPEPPSPQILRDVFGRFGNLIDVFMIGTKTCGYAKYASKESADTAMNTLNGQYVCNARLKVILAEPAKGESGRKRLKMDD